MTHRCVLTIGNFDGVHLGHRAILRAARARADAARMPLVAMTFDPHPATVLHPGQEPPRLMTRSEKLAALGRAGADDVQVLEPTPELLAQTAEAFVADMVKQHAPAALVEGDNFRFGHQRRGDVARLRTLGAQHGFTVEVVAPVRVVLHDMWSAPVSSSLVRWLLAAGRVADAARCLAQPYVLTAPVVEGEKRGRTIGVPTVNLAPSALVHRAVPADGVYAGIAQLDDGTQHAAALSVGSKPTFAGAPHAVEAHLLDFAGDLYGQKVSLLFCRWIRDQQPFPNVDDLVAQIARDVAYTRQLHEMGLLTKKPQATSHEQKALS